MSPTVAGIDLLHASERDADGVLLALFRDLPGALTAGASTATHAARTGDLAHVALSVELVDVGPDAAWRLLAARLPAAARAAPEPGAWALCVAGRAEGPGALVRSARDAQQAHAARRSGRVVHFPGSDELRGTMSVSRLIERSAVDRVRVLGGGDAAPDLQVVTRQHVRPSWSDGELVLLVQPAVGGAVVPFESPDPTPCCADHA